METARGREGGRGEGRVSSVLPSFPPIVMADQILWIQLVIIITDKRRHDNPKGGKHSII